MLEEFQSDTRVVNLLREDYDVLIARPSKWGNPYTHKKEKTAAKFLVASRKIAIEKYREWILKHPQLLSEIEELRGKKLGCYCHPKPCHGNVLIELLNTNKL